MKKIVFSLALAAFALLLATAAYKVNTEINATTTLLPQDRQATTTESVVEEKSNIKNESAIKETKKMNHVTLQTNKGNIVLELRSETPKTTENFLKLASSGFYDGVKFHRVIKGFMIQAGDPQSKDESLKGAWGTGGPGYKFADELTGRETYPQGTLAMANAGPNTNGSQFFIVTAPNAPLPPSYTVFGKVISGLDIALAIENVATDGSDKPLQNVIIEKATAQ